MLATYLRVTHHGDEDGTEGRESSHARANGGDEDGKSYPEDGGARTNEGVESDEDGNKKAQKAAAPAPMKASDAMKTMKAMTKNANHAKKHKDGEKAMIAPKDEKSSWIQIHTVGIKIVIVEPWTDTNEDVMYKVYNMS